MRISIIIPSRTPSQHLVESLSRVSELDYDDYEVVVLSDESLDLEFPKTRIVATGRLSPSQKRNIGVQLSTGEVVAFLDDDAFPRRDWLVQSSRILCATVVGAVCGPAISAPSNDIWERATSAVLESPLGSGPFRYRFIFSKPREVDDYPTCNLLMYKSIFLSLGGFDPSLYPGEDTKLCLDFSNKLHQKIVYHPDIVVYHHRRPLFIQHLSQIGMYAATRGYFARVYPKTSRRIAYFLPSILVSIGLLTLVTSVWLDQFGALFLVVAIFYAVTAILFTECYGSRAPGWIVILGIAATHMCYGVCFIYGMLIARHRKLL